MATGHSCPGRRGKYAVLCAAIAMLLAVSASAQVQFAQIDLVSDIAGVARFYDGNVMNSWGIFVSPHGMFWTANKGTGRLTSFTFDGTPGTVVVVPLPPGKTGTSRPTGIALNDRGEGFTVTQGGRTGSGVVLTATEDGTIAAWSPTVDVNNAVIAVNNSATGAVYKGLTIAEPTEGNPQVYVTNFASGQVEVYDKNWNKVKAFTDTTVPAGYAPFGIHNLTNRDLWVTFVRKSGNNDVPGAGNAVVDVFNLDGTLRFRFGQGKELNSPWGVANPGGSGFLAGLVLISNAGDGRINAFDALTRTFLGPATDVLGRPIVLSGVHGLAFVGQTTAGVATSDLAAKRIGTQVISPIPTVRLFFASGPGGGSQGLVGEMSLLRHFSGATTGGFALPAGGGLGAGPGDISFGGGFGTGFGHPGQIPRR